MSDTPDLSKVVGIIMQNPELIAEISSLVKSSESTDEPQKAEDTEASAKEEVRTERTVSQDPLTKIHRRELLNAMKPYLSENRRVAIDSMSSILDVIDVMIKR